jgi:hypothetical protein
MSTLTYLMRAELRDARKELNGKVLTRPQLLVTDGTSLIYAADVDIGVRDPKGDEQVNLLVDQFNTILRNVPIARSDYQLIYAEVGAAVRLRRNDSGQYEIFGFSDEMPGKYIRIGVDLEDLALDPDEDVSVVGRVVAYGDLVDFGGYGEAPYGLTALYVGDTLLDTSAPPVPPESEEEEGTLIGDGEITVPSQPIDSTGFDVVESRILRQIVSSGGTVTHVYWQYLLNPGTGLREWVEIKNLTGGDLDAWFTQASAKFAIANGWSLSLTPLAVGVHAVRWKKDQTEAFDGVTYGLVMRDPAIVVPSIDFEFPRVLGSDGSKFVLIGDDSQVYSSTDGQTWTSEGAMAGSSFPSNIGSALDVVSVTNSGLHNISGRWFLVYGQGLYYTDDSDAQSGWTRPLGLPSELTAGRYANTLVVRSGYLWAAVVGEESGMTQVYRSADMGDTFTLHSAFPGELFKFRVNSLENFWAITTGYTAFGLSGGGVWEAANSMRVPYPAFMHDQDNAYFTALSPGGSVGVYHDNFGHVVPFMPGTQLFFGDSE